MPQSVGEEVRSNRAMQLVTVVRFERFPRTDT